MTPLAKSVTIPQTAACFPSKAADSQLRETQHSTVEPVFRLESGRVASLLCFSPLSNPFPVTEQPLRSRLLREYDLRFWPYPSTIVQFSISLFYLMC